MATIRQLVEVSRAHWAGPLDLCHGHQRPAHDIGKPVTDSGYGCRTSKDKNSDTGIHRSAPLPDVAGWYRVECVREGTTGSTNGSPPPVGPLHPAPAGPGLAGYHLWECRPSLHPRRAGTPGGRPVGGERLGGRGAGPHALGPAQTPRCPAADNASAEPHPVTGRGPMLSPRADTAAAQPRVRLRLCMPWS